MNYLLYPLRCVEQFISISRRAMKSKLHRGLKSLRAFISLAFLRLYDKLYRYIIASQIKLPFASTLLGK